MFGNNSAILADSDTKATDTLYDIACLAQLYRLKINPNKTKVLTTDGSLAIVFFDEVQMLVHLYKYLGSLVQLGKVRLAQMVPMEKRPI